VEVKRPRGAGATRAAQVGYGLAARVAPALDFFILNLNPVRARLG